MTNHRTLFAALAAPFAAGDVKQRNQAGRTFSYVTARTVMNRLDEVVGPENWWDDYTPLENSVICRLTIRLPDGQLLTKCDAGGCAGMADAGDDDKSGYSDAFKRTAVKFGTGRYLYRDGVATLTSSSPAEAQIPAETPPGAQLSAGTSAAPAPAPERKITTGYQLYQWAAKCKIDARLIAWITMAFPKCPAKITNWSQAQVAEALPKIREHLEQVRREAA
jgi:hypothetical protein